MDKQAAEKSITTRMLALTPMLQATVLGFRCTGKEDGWCRLERNQVALMFMRNAHLGEPHATATQYIYVDDVMALWNAIKHRVTAEWEPEQMPYGMLEFAIKDPDGYLLSLGQCS